MSYSIPEIEIAVKFKKETGSQLYRLTTVKECADMARQIFNADTIQWIEEFLMICVNRQNELIGFYKVSKGGMTATLVDVRVICTTALQTMAHSVIIAHNHPSGSLTPSEADKAITARICEAFRILDIKLIDHLILTTDNYFSFLNEGLL